MDVAFIAIAAERFRESPFDTPSKTRNSTVQRLIGQANDFRPVDKRAGFPTEFYEQSSSRIPSLLGTGRPTNIFTVTVRLRLSHRTNPPWGHSPAVCTSAGILCGMLNFTVTSIHHLRSQEEALR